MKCMFCKKKEYLGYPDLPKITFGDTLKYDRGAVPWLTRRIVLNVLTELEELGLLFSSLEYDPIYGGVGRVWRPVRREIEI